MSDQFIPLCGALQPDQPRFASVPTWAERNPVLPQSEWREHDDHADLCPPIEAQVNNNCTNAALSHMGGALFRLHGLTPPRFSWAALYARNNGGRDQGAFCRDLAADFLRVGLLPSEMWPDSQIFGQWNSLHTEVAANWKALEIYQCMNFADVASALSRGFLVYHGFVLGNGGVSNPRDGRMPEYDRQFSNGHAMWSRGLTRRFGDWRTITPNTWGTSWGDKGVGYWPASYFWLQSGNMVNLDAFAVRAAAVQADKLPAAA